MTLTQLNSGVTTLKGAYANNVSSSAVTSSTRTYNFNRSQAGFEQVMGYYQHHDGPGVHPHASASPT